VLKKQLVNSKKKIFKNNKFHWVFFSFHRIVDFVLRDPRETQTEVKEETLPHRQEIAILPKPWHSSFIQAQKFTEKNLHSINPAMAQVLSMWHKNVFK
jgi:hypothetical protein